MRRIMLIANTYYQLIMAIQMRNTLFSDDEVVLLLSDHSLGADVICQRLNKEKVFSETYFIETKTKCADTSKKAKVLDVLNAVFPKSNRFIYCLKEVSNKYFDEIICYNFSQVLYGVFTELCRYNSNIVVSVYEEGILAYKTHNQVRGNKRVNELRELMGKKSLRKSLRNFFCFYPSLYSGALTPVEVPLIVTGDMCSTVLKRIFNISESQLSYPEKFVFFTSVYDFEGGEPIGEYELVEKVAELVGKENLLVKIHPRDTRTCYADNGFKVDRNSNIPWEAIQLSCDFSEKVFLTATSGSVLAGSFMAEEAVKTFYLFNLCNIENNPAAQNTVRSTTELLHNNNVGDVLNKVGIAEAIEDILV